MGAQDVTLDQRIAFEKAEKAMNETTPPPVSEERIRALMNGRLERLPSYVSAIDRVDLVKVCSEALAARASIEALTTELGGYRIAEPAHTEHLYATIERAKAAEAQVEALTKDIAVRNTVERTLIAEVSTLTTALTESVEERDKLVNEVAGHHFVRNERDRLLTEVEALRANDARRHAAESELFPMLRDDGSVP